MTPEALSGSLSQVKLLSLNPTNLQLADLSRPCPAMSYDNLAPPTHGHPSPTFGESRLRSRIISRINGHSDPYGHR